LEVVRHWHHLAGLEQDPEENFLMSFEGKMPGYGKACETCAEKKGFPL
jgi:hypothetical protein